MKFSHRTARTSLFLCLQLFTFTALSWCQKPGQPGFYAEREAHAPREVRTLLKTTRAQIAEHHLHYTVGYTTKALHDDSSCAEPPADMLRMAAKQNEAARKALQAHPHDGYAACSVNAASFDWTSNGGVTPVPPSQQCGDCWGFATVAALESSYILQHSGSAGASVQDLVACRQGVLCSVSGSISFDQTNKGIASAIEVPYSPSPSSAACSNKTTYQSTTYGYVDSQQNIPTIGEIKQALCLYGSVATYMYASLQFQIYTGGVFEDMPGDAGKPVNHAVTIVGWDDTMQAWRIKGTWGTGWGDSGFGWIKYTSASMGLGSQWVVSN
jgi:cathepsin L